MLKDWIPPGTFFSLDISVKEIPAHLFVLYSCNHTCLFCGKAPCFKEIKVPRVGPKNKKVCQSMIKYLLNLARIPLLQILFVTIKLVWMVAGSFAWTNLAMFIQSMSIVSVENFYCASLSSTSSSMSTKSTPLPRIFRSKRCQSGIE